jgi:hypothetical protein
MASLTGQLVAETYKALLKLIDNDILTASEKQITDGFGGGSNVFIDSQGFLRANKYKITNGLATQFLKADGSLDSNAYLTSITGAQVITALGYTPVPTTRTITINGETHNLAADNSWTVGGTAAIWGNITGTLSNQTDLQNALNAKYNNPTGTISQYIRGDGTLATFPTMPGGLPTGGTAGQILAKIDATDYNTQWIDNYATQTKNEVKLGQAISKGMAVYVSSANGTNIIVSKASNTSEATSSKTFGLLETGGATNDIVKCVTFGLLAGLDTSTAQAGDPVWLGVNGALIFGLANKPVAPAHMVYIGVVTRVQSNNGEIFVNVQNGFEIEELHDVLIQSKANNDGIFYESSTGLWKNKSIATVLGYTPQAQLSGTGFVKASGTTITYDNSTYLTTTDAATTYQRIDKMVSNLLPSATEYPNSNAVIAALALKADAANPVFTGNMTISGAEPKLYFTDTDQNPDYFIGVDAGFFRVYDQTAGATRFVINSDGNISTGTGKSITAGSFIKDGGTATQFLKADGSVDSTDYATVASLSNYLLSATAASTYQTLANLSTDLTASATKYPSVNAVNTGLATKQPLDADLTAIAGLTGTSGFLKKTAADTWTLDTSTYLTTGDASTTYLAITTAASTYQRLDKMVSNLLPSSTEYPNSNAVINALALKADAANPVFTGNMTISGATPRLYFVDTDQNPDYTVFIDSGYFYIYDQTAGATRFSINSSGNINTGVGKSITAGSFIKEGGTSSQFLMADGSVSTFAGVTGSGTTNYIPKWTSGSGLGNSLIYDDGTNVGIGTTAMYGKLSVSSHNSQGVRIDTNAGYPALSISGTGQIYVDAPGIVGGRFAIFDNGNTSIGSNTDSGFKLNVNGTGRFVGNLKLSSGGTLNIVPTSYGSNGFVAFRNIADTATRWNVYNYTIGGTTYGSLQFSTGDGVDKLRIEENGAATFANSITGNGNIDINLTSPLFIANASSASYFGGLSIRQSGTEKIRYAANSDVGGYIYSATWNGFSFLSDSGTYIRINTNGNVGINTTTDAGYKFDVNGTGRFSTSLGVGAGASNTTFQVNGDWVSGYSTVRIQGATSSQVGLGLYDIAGARKFVFASTGSVGYIETATGVPIDFQLGGTSRIKMSASGVLGIGDLDPTNTYLSVKGDWPSGYATVKIAPSTSYASGGSAGIGLFDSNGSTRFAYFAANNNQIELWVGANKPLLFGTADTERARLTNIGNFWIGGTNFGGDAKLGVSNGGYEAIEFNPSISANVTRILSYNRNTSVYIKNLQVASDFQWQIGGNDKMRLSPDGQLIVGDTSMTYTNSSQGYMAGFKGGITSQAYISIATSNHALASQGVIIGYDTSYARFHVRQNLGISFGTNDTSERIIITNTGNLLAGRTADSGERIQVTTGNATAIRIDTNANYNAINIGGYGNISVDYPGIGGGRFYLDGGGALTIRQSMTATSFFESSDFRKKKLIEHNPIVAGIENLQCKLYEKDGKIELGYFAQDAELIMPYAVTKNADGFLNLSYREVHTAKIARLEQRVAELEKQLNLN